MLPPKINSLTSEAWVMEPKALQSFLAAVKKLETVTTTRIELEQDEQQAPDGKKPYELADAVARISVSGVLLKSGAWMYRAFGIDATDYAELGAALDTAANDPSVRMVQLEIDSPGGQASGIYKISDKINAMEKPVSAHVTGMAASGGYWIASQADEIEADRGAQVGSIGAYAAVYDESDAAEKQGIKVHVVSSGPYKGAGVPGSAITADHLKEIQAKIDELAKDFVSDVARGRGMDATAVAEVADGRVYNNDEAVKFGLIDRVATEPMKEMKTMDSLKMVSALVTEFPFHAKLVADFAASGKDEAAIRSEIGTIEAKAVTEKLAAEHKAASERADKAEKALADVTAKADAQAKELSELKAKYDSLSGLAKGAKPAEKVAVDPGEKPVVKISEEQFHSMSGRERAAFLRDGGVIL